MFCFLPQDLRDPFSPTRDRIIGRCFNHWTAREFLWEHDLDITWKKLSTVYSIQFSCSVVSDSLRRCEPQHTRPPCPSPTPGVHQNPWPLCWWCHSTISSSVIPFSSCPQSFPASGSFPMSQLCASGGQSIGVSDSASVPPMNTQDWFPLGWTGWISL